MKENRKIIKLKIFQEKAVFRVPYSMEVIETSPLPPYSTVLGFIHNMMSKNNTIKDINISIQGKYGNVLREFVRYHKFEKKNNIGKFYPIIITSLIDVELIIHIRMPTKELHNELLFSLHNPPHFPYLGRPEDLITHMEILEDYEYEVKITDEMAINPYDSFIPFELAKNLKINGIYYFVPGYYVLKLSKKKNESFRDFEIIKVVYAHKEEISDQITAGTTIKLDSENIPIWWMRY